MKKRLLSLALATIALAQVLVPNALASNSESKPSSQTMRSYYTLECSNLLWNEKDVYDLYDYASYELSEDAIADDFGNYYSDTTQGCYRVNPKVAFRVVSSAPTDSDYFIRILMQPYHWEKNLWKLYDDPYTFDAYSADNMWPSKLGKDGFGDGDYYPISREDAVTIYPGESFIFNFDTLFGPDQITSRKDDEIIRLSVCVYYSDTSYYSFSNYFYIDSSVDAGTIAKTDASISFDSSYAADDGVVYDYTLTNHTQQALDGYFALVSYSPKKYSSQTGETFISAQVHPIRISLNPGQTTTGHLTSEFGELSNKELIWVQFDSQDELDSFLSSPVLNRLTSGYGDRYTVSNDGGEEWLNANFGVTLK